MDNAFKTAPFAAYTTKQLQIAIVAGSQASDRMHAEIARRARVEAGDVEVMTPGERLRFAKTGKAR
ncbi:MAG: hypothetical protein E5V54_11310 [Mesorhizobium sp.]|nr:MAG: hypothetical protein E5V54_11310 [Mesorhizobium sp.]